VTAKERQKCIQKRRLIDSQTDKEGEWQIERQREKLDTPIDGHDKQADTRKV
jgi:hypothetical protein